MALSLELAFVRIPEIYSRIDGGGVRNTGRRNEQDQE
jgi:hypothetical protein